MRRVPLFLVTVLALALPACDEQTRAPGTTSPDPSPDAPATDPTDATTPTATHTPTPETGSRPGRARCTLVLGMSITQNWFEDGAFETLPGIDDATWELIWESGHDVWLFADPSSAPYAKTPLSPCDEEPDRALFQVAAREWGSTEDVVARLRQTIENIRTTWPTVEVVELIPIVGGPGGGPCRDADRPDKSVLASLMNPAMVEAIEATTNGDDVRAGPDLRLADCSLFRDGTGHLTPEGSDAIASVLAEHYGT